jgi:predicted transcriptional regulator
MSRKNLDTLISEALDNIRSDRKVAREFLNDIANELVNDTEQLKHLSPVAAKHIETLQRSNEQLVKLIGIQQKNESRAVEFELSEEDKSSLFDLIQGVPGTDG